MPHSQGMSQLNAAMSKEDQSFPRFLNLPETIQDQIWMYVLEPSVLVVRLGIYPWGPRRKQSRVGGTRGAQMFDFGDTPLSVVGRILDVQDARIHPSCFCDLARTCGSSYRAMLRNPTAPSHGNRALDPVLTWDWDLLPPPAMEPLPADVYCFCAEDIYFWEEGSYRDPLLLSCADFFPFLASLSKVAIVVPGSHAWQQKGLIPFATHVRQTFSSSRVIWYICLSMRLVEQYRSLAVDEVLRLTYQLDQSTDASQVKVGRSVSWTPWASEYALVEARASSSSLWDGFPPIGVHEQLGVGDGVDVRLMAPVFYADASERLKKIAKATVFR